MKITAIEQRTYDMPLDPPFKASWDPEPRRHFAATIVFVETDQGITGIGSGDAMAGFTGHEHLFLGWDPFAIERHWQVLDNIDLHVGRCWPLDLALWDIMAKSAGVPVARLLGGKQEKVAAYASTGEIVPPKERAKRALRFVEQGFQATKIRFHHDDPRDDIRVVEAVREAVDDKLEIMVDANQGWKMPWDTEPTWDLKTAASVARELEKLDVYWLEEPLPADDFDGMAALREMTTLRIAGGEMNRRMLEFRELSRRRSIDVCQADVCLCGGITGVRRIARMMNDAGAAFSPHTWCNGIGLMANLHLTCAVGGGPYLELPYDPPLWGPDRRDYMIAPEDRPMIDGQGFLHIPDRPGFGFRLDEEALTRWETGRHRAEL